MKEPAPPQDDWWSSNKDFPDNWRKSQPAVRLVAQHFIERGYDVVIPPQSLRRDPSEIEKHVDHGDLFINGKRVEVKHRNRDRKFDFTSVADFPYESAIVTVAKNWDEADPKPYCYVFVNYSATVMALVKGDTYASWWKDRKPCATVGGALRTFYYCSKHILTFIPIEVTTLVKG